MAEKTEQDPQITVDGLDGEIAELERQRGTAVRQIRGVEARFRELEERRSVLSPRTFAGDEGAAEELREVEDEHDRLARSVRVAESALPGFDGMLEDLKGRRERARRAVHERRYGDLLAERDALTPRAEELAKELREVLERQASLYADAGQDLRQSGEHDRANAMHVNGMAATRGWLEQRFGARLG